MVFDIAVVGAGPAGAFAAYELACRGARVAIFDPSHPREKPCGGGITGRALALVGSLVAGRDLPTSRIRTARFFSSTTGDSQTVSLETSDDAPPDLVVASRTAFDGLLLSAAREAGARLIEERVADLVVEPRGVRLDTRRGAYRASFVIGADGANSLVRRRLSRPFSRDDLSIATGYFAHGVTSDEIVIELVATPPGYIWSFPRPDHLAIGICAQANARVKLDDLRLQAKSWIVSTGIGRDVDLEAYSWPIPSLGVQALGRLELSGSAWCVIGDAAGLVDPITREGIYFGLLSGRMAADALMAGRPADEYAARVHEGVISELARAARFKAAFFKPAFTTLLLRALRDSAAIRSVMADLIAGRQMYKDLKWRLVRTLDVPLAWRAFTKGFGRE